MKLAHRIRITALACVASTFASFTLTAAETAPTPITPTTSVELINGKDLTGWKAIMRDNADPAQTWRVEGGILKCTGKAVGYLRTESSYREYQLTIEWRFVKVAPKADNTGILLHITQPDKLWPRCLQYQGQHGKLGEMILMEGADCKEHQGMTTDRFPTREAASEKPVGEWNTSELVCAGDRLKFLLNGKLANEVTGCNLTSGSLGFQSEGAEFEVRSVKIEPVKKP